MNQESQPSNDWVLGIPVLIMVAVGVKKIIPIIQVWYHRHFWQIWFSISTVLFIALAILGGLAWNWWAKRAAQKDITRPDEKSVFLGKNDGKDQVHLKQSFRTMHTQVIGTTNAGKTESVILPWAIRDLETKSGLLIIDGKSDSSFLEKFYAYVVRAGRQRDFRLFSLADVEKSSSFNPLVGGTAQEVAERVFSSFPFENEYYKNIQYKIFLKRILLLEHLKLVPTMHKIQRLLNDMDYLQYLLLDCTDEYLKKELWAFSEEGTKERLEKVSGLDAHLSHFSTGKLATLFNQESSGIQMDEVLRHNRICYFQLPTLYFPFLGSATGKLVLQSFSSAVAKRHLGTSGKKEFFATYLDDFQDYLYENFGSLLNKSRSANVGVVFSHQAIGDLEKVGPAFKDVVLSNTNVKIVMRSNNPDTCEYFAKSFGTKKGLKSTERRKKELFGAVMTGDGSVREVEEYLVHPNEIKQLGVGQGFVSIPHPGGLKIEKINFQRRPDIKPIPLPLIPHDPIVIENIPEEIKSNTTHKPALRA